MIAIEVASPGGPEMLRPAERPMPRPGPGEVLIQVAAAGVNRPDALQRRGLYAPPPGVSDIPGLEVAGEVVQTGAGVVGLRPGDSVTALLAGGGYAEYAVAPEPQCLAVPRGLSMTEAAALPETFFTVWTNVFDRGGLRPGGTLLVHGGTSGIGTTAIALARALGSRVFATAGSPEKCRACEELGAERGIDRDREDFVTIVRDATRGSGVDVILDMAGGDFFPRNLRALADAGRLVQIAYLRGSKAEIDLELVMRRRLVITGSTLRPRSVEEKGRIAEALRERVWPLLEAGSLRPVVHATFPLAAAADAHRLMESGEHLGKLVLLAR
ncbi:MAG TPA: NAD(P)H-quinone oxidoreductase [Vicinamibacteria bacterium]|nr:NAD(P)H-quinone oxidoreductase [Vicinamibacteria bacterium]